jgi:23S rRNA (cytosine1962-C5)-methyltransferase
MMRLSLSRAAAQAVRRGHPWVFRDGLAGRERREAKLASGDVVVLAEAGEREPLATALYDAESPIAARVLALGELRVDEAFLNSRLEDALSRRDRWFASSTDTTAYRLVHGEGDRLPGLVVDRYGPVAVLKLDGAVWSKLEGTLVRLLTGALERRGVRKLGRRVRAPHASAEAEPRYEPIVGGAPPDPLVVSEHGVRFEVSVLHGQKTGAFLDQRENRRRVGELTRRLGARRVLNLFSYAGGFSLAAALGGAERVTSVDVASHAHATAQRSFRENGLDPSEHAFVTSDVFQFLARARERGETFSLVVSDPPSFAPSERAREGALRAYRRLHAAAASVLAPGGVLCAASCSSHVSMDDFTSTLDDRSLGRADLSLLEAHGPPCDHPTLAAWPEGRYLKLVVLG